MVANVRVRAIIINATKAKKNKNISGNDITPPFLNMDTENIDKYKELMGPNDIIIGCTYSHQKDKRVLILMSIIMSIMALV